MDHWKSLTRLLVLFSTTWTGELLVTLSYQNHTPKTQTSSPKPYPFFLKGSINPYHKTWLPIQNQHWKSNIPSSNREEPRFMWWRCEWPSHEEKMKLETSEKLLFAASTTSSITYARGTGTWRKEPTLWRRINNTQMNQQCLTSSILYKSRLMSASDNPGYIICNSEQTKPEMNSETSKLP
jgi:hypothetical protein